MSIYPKPKVRFENTDFQSSPVEARLDDNGMIRLVTNPDSLYGHGAWLTPDEIREFALELTGLADASEAIYGPHPDHRT